MAMEAYLEAKSEYDIVYEVTMGCGSRAQSSLDKAYSKLTLAHAALTPEQQAKNPCPRPRKCSDDGIGGASYGLTTVGRVWAHATKRPFQ